MNGRAVVFGQLVIVVVDHDFKQRSDRAELGGRQQIEQRVSLLAFLLKIVSHIPFQS